jgi:hypothetical protein
MTNKKHIQCMNCMATGKLKGLGNLPIDCKACKGVGWHANEDTRTEDEILNTSACDPIISAPNVTQEVIGSVMIKRRGRKAPAQGVEHGAVV